MSNKLRQPRIAAQVCEIVHALSAAAFKITKLSTNVASS